MMDFYKGVGMSDGKRCPFDRYETPKSVTEALLNRIQLDLPPRVREPACGTGRIARVLEAYGFDVHATDLQEDEVDFLEETDRCESIVGNPPYQKGLAEAFIRKSLELTDGPVWLLLKHGILWSQKRAANLWQDHPPDQVLIIPKRILFYKADGTRIEGQAYDHAWFGWQCGRKPLDWIMPDELYDA